MSLRNLRHVLAGTALALGATLGAGSAEAAEAKKFTVVYIAPSLDISYWQ